MKIAILQHMYASRYEQYIRMFNEDAQVHIGFGPGETYDAIVIGHQGPDAVRDIRALQDTPILYIAPTEEYMHQAYAAGADLSIFQCGITAEKLYDALESIVRNP